MAWLAAGLAVIVVCLLVALIAALAGRATISALAVAVAVTTRVLLVLRGYLFEPGQVRLLDLALAATILVIVAVVAYHLLSDVNAEQRTAWVAAVLALPVAAYALLQLVVPAAPAQAGAPACGGAPLAGSDFQAKTGQFGLNARSGPGTTFAPQRRFDASCTVGVDGYCVGESVGDISVPLPDVRWLRLRHTDSYVAAGAVFSLSPEAELGDAPEDDCPLGLDDPALDGPAEVTKTGPETLNVTARPVRTRLVGFGLYYEQPDGAEELVEQLGITAKLVNADGQVRAGLNLTAIRAAALDATHVHLAVVPCLAPIVPSHSGEQILRIDLRTAQTEPLRSPEPPELLDRLRQAGCRIDPTVGAAEVAEAAQTPP